MPLPPPRCARATAEDAPPRHGGAGAPGGQANQVRRDRNPPICLLIPQHERTRDDLHAVALRAVAITPRIRSDDIDMLRLDGATAYLVTRQELYHPNRAQISQHQATEVLDVGVVEECTAVDVRVQLDVFDLVVAPQLDTILTGGEAQGHARTRSPQRLTGRQAKRPQSRQGSCDDQVANRRTGGPPRYFRPGGKPAFPVSC